MKALIAEELREWNGKPACGACILFEGCEVWHRTSGGYNAPDIECPLRNSPADSAVREAERILQAILDNNGCDIGMIGRALEALKKAKE